ncbi:hemerythrin domain-containing protein [Algihabitans albus]|uniref:hemerythrin domain-containing protein n=1 Tax=Algihabitans albus TaxID=2164067 RepID=UPI000E5C6A3E|nr:hemerythrin domain-containing protein [Algihabitans albus]
MAETLRRLQEDHRNIARLLQVLEHQLALFAEDGEVDYEVMTGALEYMRRYPDLEHHPREDRVMQQLRQRDPEAAEKVGDLEREHIRLKGVTERFTTALENVLAEQEVSREAFTDLGRDFVAQQRAHMRTEDETFFPAAERSLTAQDWAEVEASMTQVGDPLFGPRVAQECAALHEHLLQWDRESGSPG